MFFTTTARVELSQIDTKNFISNKGILSLLEETAEMHSASIGYGITNIPETHLSWVILNWKVQIFSRPKYNDIITIKTWSRYSKKFFTYRDYEIYDKDGKLLIIATSKWILIDINNENIARIPDTLIKEYQSEEKSVFNILEVEKLKEPTTSSFNTTYSVRRSDIDVNKHMHNLNYLDVAYEALPDDVYYNTTFNNIEILYKHQIKLGETVNCLYSKNDNEQFVTIKNINNDNLHAIIKLF